MSYQVPGMLDDNEEVEYEQARTEVLAQAFADTAGEYFKRLKRYEDNITEAEEEIDQMKKIAVGAQIVGIVLIVGGTTLPDGNNPYLPVVGVGLLVMIVGGAYAYRKYTAAEERIEENEQNIEENEPDGEVTFVSQIGVPLYLIPYQDRHMIFDGLDAAPQTTLDLAHIDGDKLIAERERLEELQEIFKEYLTGEAAVPPEFAEKLSPGVTEHRQLERPISDQIDQMTAVAEDIDRDTIEVNVHANNTKAKSVQKFARGNLLHSNGDLMLVETDRSVAESQAVVDEIRGVEEEAISGDMLDQAREYRQRINEIATEHAERLQDNSKTVDEHFQSYVDAVAMSMHKHVCEECLEDEIKNVTEELGLVDEILETGSLGKALSDQDLDRGTDEHFTQRIREDMEERIPELDIRLREAYNTLEDLGADDGYCNVHGSVDTEEIADSGAVFGEVWRSLYYTFREPIMESADDLERDAEEARQAKEQKMIDLTQYEQIKDNVRREYQSVKSEYEAARTVEQHLG